MKGFDILYKKIKCYFRKFRVNLKNLDQIFEKNWHFAYSFFGKILGGIASGSA